MARPIARGGALDERDGDQLAALAQHGQRAVPALKSKVVDVRGQGFGDPQPVDRQQTDQGVLGGGAQFGRNQQRTQQASATPRHAEDNRE